MKILDNFIIRTVEYISNIYNNTKGSNWSKSFGKGTIFDSGNKVKDPYSQIANIYKAIKAIADNAPQAELLFKDFKSNEIIKDDKLERLLENPNPLMDYTDFIQACAGLYALNDELLIIKVNGQITNNLPVQLYPMNSKLFEEVLEKDSSGAIINIKGWRNRSTQSFFPSNEVIFSRGFNPNSFYRGLAPTEVIQNEIDIAYNSLLFNKYFFLNSATPSLAFSTDQKLNEVEMDRFQSWFNKTFKGVSKSLKTILLGHGLKATPLSHSHTDMEFIEQSKYMREETLGIWRVPKSLFSITDDLNYATSREQKRIFWEDTLLPILNKIGGALNKGIIKNYKRDIYICFSTDNIPAFKEVYKEKVKTGLDLKALGFTRNQINEKLNLGFESDATGDVILVPFGVVPIETAIEQGESRYDIPSNESEPKSIIKIENKINRSEIWKVFLKPHTRIESRLKNVVSKYIYEQRIRLLKDIEKNYSNAIIKDVSGYDWDLENELLIQKFLPYITASIKIGADFAEQFNIQALNLDKLKHDMSSAIIGQTQEIKRINYTIKKQVQSKIADVVQEGITQGLTQIQIATNIREGVKNVYNIAQSRSLTIARTTTTASINKGSMTYYENANVRRKQWLTADDENVRISHIEQNEQIVNIESEFKNGLQYPGDPSGSAEEIINCRCTLTPYISE